MLSTCWPLDAVTPGPLRYLVHAEMIRPDTGGYLATIPAFQPRASK